MILTQGIHPDIPMVDYIADPAPEPSVSTGIAQALIEQTPSHANLMHPRLGGVGGEASARGDLGSAIHSLVFGGPEIVYVDEVARKTGKDKGVPFTPTDWMTADAKEQRDAIRAQGKLPMLPHQRGVIEGAAENARSLLAERFGPGRSEMTMVWQEAAWCRSRADFLTDCGGFDVDLKTCENASPESWERTLASGYYYQAALRARGHQALSGRTRDVVFLLVEIAPPFAVSLVAMDPAYADLADRRVQRAIATWAECLRTGVWPSYRKDIHYASLPSRLEWAESMRGAA